MRELLSPSGSVRSSQQQGGEGKPKAQVKLKLRKRKREPELTAALVFSVRNGRGIWLFIT